MRPPSIDGSTREERAQYISETFRCKSNCEACGFCAVYRGQSAEIVYADYIAGNIEFFEIAKRYR